jgi:hypothetical protein
MGPFFYRALVIGTRKQRAGAVFLTAWTGVQTYVGVSLTAARCNYVVCFYSVLKSDGKLVTGFGFPDVLFDRRLGVNH